MADDPQVVIDNVRFALSEHRVHLSSHSYVEKAWRHKATGQISEALTANAKLDEWEVVHRPFVKLFGNWQKAD